MIYRDILRSMPVFDGVILFAVPPDSPVIVLVWLGDQRSC